MQRKCSGRNEELYEGKPRIESVKNCAGIQSITPTQTPQLKPSLEVEVIRQLFNVEDRTRDKKEDRKVEPGPPVSEEELRRAATKIKKEEDPDPNGILRLLIKKWGPNVRYV